MGDEMDLDVAQDLVNRLKGFYASANSIQERLADLGYLVQVNTSEVHSMGASQPKLILDVRVSKVIEL